MGKINKIESVKLFFGIITASEKLYEKIEPTLEDEWGKIDFTTDFIAFDFTDYYSKEMGNNLLRRWISFEKLIEPSEISKIKTQTNLIEQKTSESEKRRINIDPGYLALSKVILASTKDFSHRIYLSDGIYAEITLIYKQKIFTSLDWTYPDYKYKTAQDFFNKIRNRYHNQLQKTI